MLSKSTIRSWDKGPNNQGKLFSVNLLDKEDSEVRATFFREGVDMFYDLLEVGKVYNFSSGQVKLANKRFNNTNCDYEITFNASAEIVPVEDGMGGGAAGSIKKISVKPIKIKDISPDITGLVDVCGVVLSWGSIETFTSSAGREITKLEVILTDDSMETIKCTLFGEKCAEFETTVAELSNDGSGMKSGLPGMENQPLIICAVKGVKVSDYRGCSLGLLPSSVLYINPDIKESQELMGWARSGANFVELKSKSEGLVSDGRGGGRSGVTVSDRKDAEYINQLEEFNEEKGEYVVLKGTFSVIRKENLSYPACPEEGVNKKVVDQGDGTYYCEATGKTYNECEYRYIASMLLSDATGGVWVTGFNQQAESILGYSATELHNIKNDNEELYNSLLLEASFEEYLCTVRVKNEFYQETKKKRCVLVSAVKVNAESENRQLLEYICQHDNLV